MKQKMLAVILAVCLCVGLLPAAAMAVEPAVSSNAGQQDYLSYGKPMTSFLYDNGQGLTRVEYITDGMDYQKREPINPRIVVEDYSTDFKLLSRRQVESEMPIFGGFFAGQTYNFLIFGQRNMEQNDNTEVIRVVKYDKAWNRVGAGCLRGANTALPFDGGCVRCDEYGGFLYVRTSHLMYKENGSNINHQANMTFCVREEDMEVTDSVHGVFDGGRGYVSHSFNQFLIVDSSGTLVTADHGDTFPRSIVVMTYPDKAGSGHFDPGSRKVNSENMVVFPGKFGENATGASVGGLAETSSGYVTAYNWTGGDTEGKHRDVYLAFAGKDLTGVKNAKIEVSNSAQTPQLAPMGLDGGYLIWSDGSGLFYTSYDAQGNVGAVQTAQGGLSDCAPISWHGSAVWYVTGTENGGAPVFYTLNSSGVTAHPVDPPAGAVTDPGPEVYKIDSVQSGSCRVLPSPQQASAGDTVTLTVLTAGGKQLQSLKVLDENNREVPLTKNGWQYTFTMPDSPVTLSASFGTGSGSQQPSAAPSASPSPSPKPETTSKNGGVMVTVPGNKRYDYVNGVLERVNQERSANGSAALTLSGNLTELAMQRAAECAVYFSHTRPDGTSCFQVTCGSITYSSINGENIAVGQTSPEAVMTSWMNSDGHRANILQTSFRQIGIGCFENNGCLYWVQLFGIGSDSTPLSGTASTAADVPVEAAVSRLSTRLSSTDALSVTPNKSTALPTLYTRNQEWSHDTILRPVLSDVTDSSGKTIAKVSADGVGTGKASVTGVSKGEGTIPLMAYAEQKDPASVRLTVADSAGSKPKVYQIDTVTVGGSRLVPEPREASAGDTVTLTAFPASGDKLRSLTVRDSSGKALAVSDDGNGKYTFTMPDSPVKIEAEFSSGSGSQQPAPSASSFSDISQGSFYYDAVQWAVEEGITTGTGGSTFSPSRTCTRQEIVTFLWRAAGSPEPQGSGTAFGDVSTSAYYYKPVQWAVEEGITTGTGNGSAFSPSQPCTRQETVTFLWRAMGEPDAGASSFSDVSRGSFAYDAVSWAVANGITSGTGGNTFSPTRDCSRAEIVTFLYRTYN